MEGQGFLYLSEVCLGKGAFVLELCHMCVAQADLYPYGGSRNSHFLLCVCSFFFFFSPFLPFCLLLLCGAFRQVVQ